MSNEMDAQGFDSQAVEQGSSDEWPRFKIKKVWLAFLLLLLLALAGQAISSFCQDDLANEAVCVP